MLIKNPAITRVAIVALALGIGTTTTAFSTFNVSSRGRRASTLRRLLYRQTALGQELAHASVAKSTLQ